MNATESTSFSINTNMNCFLLTDDYISQFNPSILFLSIDRSNDKVISKIYYKFFMNSICNVTKDISRSCLLKGLQQQLNYDVYHISLNDLDELYHCIFEILPNLEAFQANSNHMDLVFSIMNLFIMRYYDIAFPFFYDSKIEDNIFSYKPPFVVNYFLKFAFHFGTKMNKKENESKYLELLKKDGSLANIFNHLFDLYNNGFDFDNVSNIIYQLIESIDCDFVYDYLQQKLFFDKSSAIFRNEKNNCIIRMNFQIAFFINFFEKRYSNIKFIKCNNFFIKESPEEINKKQEASEQIIQDINTLNIQYYLQTFLGSFIDQLIREGRFLNTENPFPNQETTQQDFSTKFYPERTNDDDIINIFRLFGLMFKTIPEKEYHTCIVDFLPIIFTAYNVVPGLFMSDLITWTLSLFNFLQDSELPQLDLFKSSLLHTVRSRLIGDYLLSDHIQNSLFCTKFILPNKKFKDQNILRKINKLSIAKFISCFYSNNHLVFYEPSEFLQSIQLTDLRSINELFRVMIYLVKKSSEMRKIAFSTFLFYLEISVDPILIKSYIKLFFVLKLTDNEFQQFAQTPFIINYINLFLNEPNISEFITQQQMIDFCQLTGKYVIDDRKFVDDAFQVAIESGDLFKMKILSIIINFANDEVYQKFSGQIVDSIINQSMSFQPETPDVDIIRRIISISPFLISFKFTENDKIYNLLRSCISYLDSVNKNQENIISIDDYHQNDNYLKFDDIIDQIKANLIYSLANSYGFAAQPEISENIIYFINKYGMCIEVLNFLSKIIEYLIPFVYIQNFPDQLNIINNNIFRIMQILVENSPEEIKTNENEEDDSGPTDFEHRVRKLSDRNQIRRNLSSEFLHYFTIFPIGYENKISSSSSIDRRYHFQNNNKVSFRKDCFYSYKMKGTKVNDHFVYSLKQTNCFFKSFDEKKNFESWALYAVNLFIRNISEYTILLLDRYGIKPGSINFYKQIILIAFRHGLIRVNTLDLLFRLMLDQDGFLLDDDEAMIWIEAAAIRASFLMISSRQAEKDASAKLEIGNKKDQLIQIYVFLYKINRIFTGSVSNKLIETMFKYSSYSINLFMKFITSNDAEMQINLHQIFS